MIETSQSPLDRLYRLQEILLDVKRKTERMERTPDNLVHVEAAYRDAVQRRDELRQKVAAAEKRKKTLEGEIAEYNEKLKKYQGQLASVKSNREYGALLDEMDGVKREVRTREDEILQLEESLESARKEASELEVSFPEEEARYEEQMTDWRAEQAILKEDVVRARSAADELRKSIEPKLLSTFDRIARARAGVAVAKVAMVAAQTAACSACHVRLRPQLLSDIRLSKEPIICDSCKRILYWEGRE